MFPLLKYSSSIITFYFYCVHLLQINFTVILSPIEYTVAMKWSISRYPEEKIVFKKSHIHWGSYTMPTNSTYVQQKSVPIESVGWQCPVDPSFYSGTDAVGFRGHFIYISVYLWTWEERMACWLFFQNNCDTMDQGKNQVIPQILQPHQYHQSPHSKRCLKGFTSCPPSRSVMSNFAYL